MHLNNDLVSNWRWQWPHCRRRCKEPWHLMLLPIAYSSGRNSAHCCCPLQTILLPFKREASSPECLTTKYFGQQWQGAIYKSHPSAVSIQMAKEENLARTKAPTHLMSCSLLSHHLSASYLLSTCHLKNFCDIHDTSLSFVNMSVGWVWSGLAWAQLNETLGCNLHGWHGSVTQTSTPPVAQHYTMCVNLQKC